ncbi:MAG: hypothetical protein HY077_14170 [Elusimicrobia bacterium]|nr:hypothetical protein [Elusimicrobiota bacterium]
MKDRKAQPALRWLILLLTLWLGASSRVHASFGEVALAELREPVRSGEPDESLIKEGDYIEMTLHNGSSRGLAHAPATVSDVLIAVWLETTGAHLTEVPNFLTLREVSSQTWAGPLPMIKGFPLEGDHLRLRIKVWGVRESDHKAMKTIMARLTSIQALPSAHTEDEVQNETASAFTAITQEFSNQIGRSIEFFKELTIIQWPKIRQNRDPSGLDALQEELKRKKDVVRDGPIDIESIVPQDVGPEGYGGKDDIQIIIGKHVLQSNRVLSRAELEAFATNVDEMVKDRLKRNCPRRALLHAERDYVRQHFDSVQLSLDRDRGHSLSRDHYQHFQTALLAINGFAGGCGTRNCSTSEVNRLAELVGPGANGALESLEQNLEVLTHGSVLQLLADLKEFCRLCHRSAANP